MQQHPRISEALALYLATRAARFSRRTVLNDKYVLDRFVHWLGEDIQVRHLKPTHVEQYFYGPAGLRAEHVTRDGKQRAGIQDPQSPSIINARYPRVADPFLPRPPRTFPPRRQTPDTDTDA